MLALVKQDLTSDNKNIDSDSFSKLEDEYISSLQDLQSKLKIDCWCEVSLHELIYTVLNTNK